MTHTRAYCWRNAARPNTAWSLASAGHIEISSATAASPLWLTFTVTGDVETPQSVLVWSFNLTAPLAKLSATLSQIVAAEQSISSNNSGLTLTFGVEGLQVSPQLQQLLRIPPEKAPTLLVVGDQGIGRRLRGRIPCWVRFGESNPLR